MLHGFQCGKGSGDWEQECAGIEKDAPMIKLKENSMDLDPLCYGPLHPPVPPSYEQCVATAVSPKADYVVSPLAMAAMFDWDDEDL